MAVNASGSIDRTPGTARSNKRPAANAPPMPTATPMKIIPRLCRAQATRLRERWLQAQCARPFPVHAAVLIRGAALPSVNARCAARGHIGRKESDRNH
jgi:hypothetical protein